MKVGSRLRFCVEGHRQSDKAVPHDLLSDDGVTPMSAHRVFAGAGPRGCPPPSASSSERRHPVRRGEIRDLTQHERRLNETACCCSYRSVKVSERINEKLFKREVIPRRIFSKPQKTTVFEAGHTCFRLSLSFRCVFNIDNTSI